MSDGGCLSHIIAARATEALLTVVIDLDETVMSHSMVADVPTNTTSSALQPRWSSAAPVASPKNSHFVVRPYTFTLLRFLHELEGEVEVVFWTNATRKYGQNFIEQLSSLWATHLAEASLLGNPSSPLATAQPGVFRSLQQTVNTRSLHSYAATIIVRRDRVESTDAPAKQGTKRTRSPVQRKPVSIASQLRRESAGLASKRRTPSASTSPKSSPLNSPASLDLPVGHQRPRPNTKGLFKNIIFSDDAGGSGIKSVRRLGRSNPAILIDNCPANVAKGEKDCAIVVRDFEWNTASPPLLRDILNEDPMVPTALAAVRANKTAEAANDDQTFLTLIECIQFVLNGVREQHVVRSATLGNGSGATATIDVGPLVAGCPLLHHSPGGYHVIQ